jgi:hypothetical protein
MSDLGCCATGKERKGKERNGTERKGKERRGKERKGKERKGKERKGKETQTGDLNVMLVAVTPSRDKIIFSAEPRSRPKRYRGFFAGVKTAGA